MPVCTAKWPQHECRRGYSSRAVNDSCSLKYLFWGHVPSGGLTTEYPAPEIYSLRIRIRSGVRPPLPPIVWSVWLSGYADTQWTSTLNNSCRNALFILYHFSRSSDFMGESRNPNWYTYPSLLSQALQFILSLLIPQVGFDASSFSSGTYLVVRRRSGDRTSLSRCDCFSSIPCFSLSKTMQCHSLVRQSFFSELLGAWVSARFTSLQL